MMVALVEEQRGLPTVQKGQTPSILANLLLLRVVLEKAGVEEVGRRVVLAILQSLAVSLILDDGGPVEEPAVSSLAERG